MEYYIKEIQQLISSKVVFYQWRLGGAVGAILKYVMHMLIENFFTKFHFVKVNKIVEI